MWAWEGIGEVTNRSASAHASNHTSRMTEGSCDPPRRQTETYADVFRAPLTWSGAAWSQTSPTSAANSSPPWPKSRRGSHTNGYTNGRSRVVCEEPHGPPSLLSLASTWLLILGSVSGVTKTDRLPASALRMRTTHRRPYSSFQGTVHRARNCDLRGPSPCPG